VDKTILTSYGAVQKRAGVVAVALGTERIAPLCSPALLKAGPPIARQIRELVLIDSQLSGVTWPQWFALNGLTLPAWPNASAHG